MTRPSENGTQCPAATALRCDTEEVSLLIFIWSPPLLLRGLKRCQFLFFFSLSLSSFPHFLFSTPLTLTFVSESLIVRAPKQAVLVCSTAHTPDTFISTSLLSCSPTCPSPPYKHTHTFPVSHFHLLIPPPHSLFLSLCLLLLLFLLLSLLPLPLSVSLFLL